VRNSEAVETLRQTGADLAVVAAYGQILPSSVLQLPKVACLNIHGSILPKYRGAAPIHYAILNGETETGVTIMYMNEKMDEGDVLLIKKTPVSPEENTGEVHDRLAKIGAEGLLEAVKLLEAGKAPRTPQDAAQASYAPSIKREFCKLDWGWTASRIHNRVRGLCPWPVAETVWKGMELKVYQTQVVERKGMGGEVLEVSKEGVLVGAGAQSVRLLSIQPPGKKRMPAFDFTLGHPDFKVGEKLS
jgi:methionyl-tRNA formyltransferase